MNNITESLIGAAHNPWLATLAIIAATFVHEDLTTIAVGIAVSKGVIEPIVGLPALLAGVMSGDLGLYGLGRLAARNHFLGKLLDPKRVKEGKHWVDDRLVLGIFVIRFLPGLRFSGYAAYGYFSAPFLRFAIFVVCAVCLWTTGLYYLAVTFGPVTQRILGYWQWPAIALAFLFPTLLAQHFMHRREKHRWKKKR